MELEDRIEDKEGDKPQEGKVQRHRAPLMIAGCLLLFSVLLFFGFKCFFDTDLTGTWTVVMSSEENQQGLEYSFDFRDGRTVMIHGGNMSYIGRYYLNHQEELGDVLSVYIGYNDTPFIVADFGYEFTGNIFTGRTLRLTDYTGIFFEADGTDTDAQTLDYKKKVTDSITVDGVTYYVWDFKPSEIVYKTEPKGDEKTDKKLTGSWLKHEEGDDYLYTINFYEDHTFEQLSYDFILKGTYSADGETCSLRYYDLSGENITKEVQYQLSGDQLKFNSVNFKRAADAQAYKTNGQIK